MQYFLFFALMSFLFLYHYHFGVLQVIVRPLRITILEFIYLHNEGTDFCLEKL